MDQDIVTFVRQIHESVKESSSGRLLPDVKAHLVVRLGMGSVKKGRLDGLLAVTRILANAPKATPAILAIHGYVCLALKVLAAELEPFERWTSSDIGTTQLIGRYFTSLSQEDSKSSSDETVSTGLGALLMAADSLSMDPMEVMCDGMAKQAGGFVQFVSGKLLCTPVSDQ